MDVSTLSSVNQTALLVVLRRAAESRRPDALFHDVLAEAVSDLLRESAMSAAFWKADDEMATLSGDAVALRTRFYDDAVEHAVRLGTRQIVMLGAGLDARCVRLNMPDVTFFDVDQSAVLSLREDLFARFGIAERFPRRSVAADLPSDGLAAQLSQAGFRPDQPCVVIAEGLLFYLADTARQSVLQQVSSLAARGSLLLLEYPAGQALTGPQDEQLTVTADFHGERADDPWTVLVPFDWSVSSRTLVDLAVDYGRPLPVQIDERRGGARWWYAAARRS